MHFLYEIPELFSHTVYQSAMGGNAMKRAAGMILAAALLLALPVTGYALEPEQAGKSGVLMELETGTILYEWNAREALPPASVTKIMTMLLVMEAVDSGKISITDTVTASEAAAAKGGSQIFLKVGEQMSVSDMLKSVAVSSANDCACALAEYLAGSEEAFVVQMNRRAEELGMEDTHFVNCTGLDDSPEAKDHRTSARDIAIMSRQLLKYHPDITKYTTIWMDTVRGGSFGLSNTNKLIRFYPGATGLKTGFTRGAGYCLSATAQRENLHLIAVVMGCESGKIRNAACKGLLDYGFANYALARAEIPEDLTLPVKLGSQDQVKLTLGDSGAVLTEKSNLSGLTTRLELRNDCPAPVTAGEPMGTAVLLSGTKELGRFPLLAAEDVPRLTLPQLYGKILRQAAMGSART